MSKFNEYREKYPNFIYHSYEIKQDNNILNIKYNFEIDGLTKFSPTISIPLKEEIDLNDELLKYLVFHVGMIELVSYFKCTCSPNVYIEAGFLNQEQINWFQKLYYNGLGEFRYLNNINISESDLMHITCTCKESELPNINYEGHGNLIPVGGGKDSCVTLELLNNMDNITFVINSKTPMKECIKASGYSNSLNITRVIDSNLIELNKEGYLNGHTPFSSLVAFLSYLVSYIYKRKYIVLSNEASANEATVLNTNINHQYSKTYEFERNFNNYTKKYFNIDIHYFSFLRPINELQIGLLFSKYKKYHKVFKSCNVGSKKENWVWCCNCAKCLFVYIILSPFLSKEELINIFSEDLLDKKELLPIFLELLGYKESKPFECVGTFEEVRYAISKTLEKRDDAYLLKYYCDNFDLVDGNYLNYFNEENNVPEEFLEILRKELKNARENN